MVQGHDSSLQSDGSLDFLTSMGAQRSQQLTPAQQCQDDVNTLDFRACQSELPLVW